MSFPPEKRDAYKFFDTLVVRMPALPLQYLERLNKQAITDLLPHIYTSIYLASVQLLTEVEKLASCELDSQRKERLFRTLYKYLSRMTTRSTPFGAFSGMMLLNWGERSNLVRQPNLWLDTKADGTYVSALANYLEELPFIQPHLLYFTNPTCWVAGGQVRYFEYHLFKHNRHYEASAVEAMPLLLTLLEGAQNGKSFRDISLTITSAGFDDDEAANFIKELISCRLLISELENPVVGKQHLTEIIDRITRIADSADYKVETASLLADLLSLQQLLPQATSHIDYRALQQQMHNLLPSYTSESYFLVNAGILSASSSSNVLSKQWQQSLLEALKILNYFQQPIESALTVFSQQLVKRYGDGSVPLLKALDMESGISYGEIMQASNTPLIDDLPFSANALPNQRRSQPQEASTLQQMWKQNKLAGLQSLELPATLVAGLAPTYSDLPPTLYAVFRIINDGAKQRLLIERFNGPTAANYITRFGHSMPDVAQLARSIHAYDQALNPKVLVAEVAHLPFERTSNVISTPASSSYTIRVVSNMLSKEQENIELSDLYLTVRNGRVVLFSRKLEKEIIPRLNNAYVYSRSTLPLFQFLCDLQSQGKRTHLHFSPSDLGIAENESFIPRTTYNDVILSPAIWRLPTTELNRWDAVQIEELLALAQTLRQAHKMPRRVFLLQGDNELLIDWENELSLLTLVQEAKKYTHIHLMESFLDSTSCQTQATDSNGDMYNAQFVALMHQAECSPHPVTNITALVKSIESPTVDQYSPFTEWQYYKFYCGEVTAERLLRELIRPLVKSLQDHGLIDQWFFLRYEDPDFHLRVRFHLVSSVAQKKFKHIFTEHLTIWEGLDLVWNIQVDTYKRELHRYSFRYISNSERIFFHDCEATVEFLAMLSEYGWAESTRWLYAARSVDSLLRDFGLTTLERFELIEQARESFNHEFAVSLSMASTIAKKYRDIRQQFLQVLNSENNLPDGLQKATALLQVRSLEIKTDVETLRAAAENGLLHPELKSIINSHIHMILNRIFQSKPRQHEMVFYNFMYNGYKTAIALKKGSVEH